MDILRKLFRKKRSMLSALIAAFTMLLIVSSSTTAYAKVGDKFVVDNLKYKITSENPKTVELIENDDVELSGEIVIPASVTYNGNDYSVTTIGRNVFRNCEEITSISIPNSITYIDNNAFCNCSKLTSITIPNSVTYIGEGAFDFCLNLTTVTIPNSVTTIGKDAFKLVKHIIYQGSATGAPWGAIAYNGTKEGDFVYEDDTKTKLLTYVGKGGEVTIPNSVTSIGEKAFYRNSSITSVNIPDNVTSIATEAFYMCLNLTSVNIPEKVTSIGKEAFDYCESLTSLTIPNSVTTIEDYAFNQCTRLTTVTIPNSVTTIGNKAFNVVKHIIYQGSATGAPWGAIAMNGIEDGDFVYEDNTKTKIIAYIGKGGNVTIPNTVTSLGKYAFYKCVNITSITIPNSITSIEDLTFFNCAGITSLTIPNSVTTIKEYAFKSCTNLTSITIPNSVTSIGREAFSQCPKLTTITIPNSVTSIERSAFSYCTSLANVTIPNSVTSIGEDAFYECTSLATVTIPNSVTSIGEDVFRKCSSITDVYLYADYEILDWKEDCDDFKENAETKCHVLSKYIEGYKAKFNGKVNVTFVDDVEEPSSNDDITISGKSNVTYTYTGKPINIEIKDVKNGDKTLEYGTDYTIYYSNDFNVGTAATIMGIKLLNFTKEITISPAPVTVTVDNKKKYYGEDDPTLTATITGLVNNESTDLIKYTLSRDEGENAGEYVITTKGEKNQGNYEVTFEAATFTIFPVPVTVTADNKKKYYGEDDPTLTATITGLVNNESTDLIKYTLSRDEGENAGEYVITTKGEKNQGNYEVTFEAATFTISPATPTYTIPKNLSLKCNQTLADLTLPKGFTIDNPKADLTLGSTNTAKATFTPEDTKNYEVVKGIEIKVAVADHVHADPVKEKESTPSCEKAGSYEEVVYCSVCGKELSRTSKTSDALGHNYAAPTYSWSDDGKTCTATAVCKNDKSHVVTETATITSQVTTAATTESKGTTTYTATFKNEIFKTQTKAVEDIDKLESNENPNTPVSSITDSPVVKVWSYNRTIYIVSTPDSQYKIIDLQGRTIATSTTKSSHEEVNINKEGVYVVIINGKTFKLSL